MNYYIYLPILVSIIISCLLIRDIDKTMSTIDIIKFIFLFMALPVLLIGILCFLSQKFPNFYIPITILTWVLLVFQYFLTQITNLIIDVIKNK